MSRSASFLLIMPSYFVMRFRYVAKLPRCVVVNRLIHDSTLGLSRLGRPSVVRELSVLVNAETSFLIEDALAEPAGFDALVTSAFDALGATAGATYPSRGNMPTETTAAMVAIAAVSIFLRPKRVRIPS